MKIICRAKINLTLDVLDRRPDGYHNIDSVMQTVGLGDELFIERSEKISVDSSDENLCGEKNIAFAAAEEFFKHTKISGGADIFIKKNIPVSAGIGGGSSDAAGVITALNEIYSVGLSKKELCQIGLKVGADVPFCIAGGTKRVQGIGEIISDVPQLDKGAFLVVKHGEKRSTADMYRKLDLLEERKHSTENMIKYLRTGDLLKIACGLSNSFEAVYKANDEKQLMLKTGALGVCMSGSGPSVFGIYPDFETAKKAEKILKEYGFFAAAALPSP